TGGATPPSSATALVRTSSKGSRVPRSALPRSIEQILAWADAHPTRTGQWPSANSGPVVEAPGETWNASNLALGSGKRRLPGGAPRARLLSRHGPLFARSGRSWNPAEDELVRTLPPQEAARQTGRSSP